MIYVKATTTSKQNFQISYEHITYVILVKQKEQVGV